MIPPPYVRFSLLWLTKRLLGNSSLLVLMFTHKILDEQPEVVPIIETGV